MKILPTSLYLFGIDKVNLRLSDVAFRANCIEDENKNTKESFSRVEKLLKLKIGEISVDKLRKFFPDIKVLPIDNTKIDAMAAIDYKDSNGVIDKKSLIMLIPEMSNQNKIAKTLFIMNLAHEYTHICQIRNNENIDEKMYKDVISAGFSDETYKSINIIAHRCHEIIAKNVLRESVECLVGQEGYESFATTNGMILINRQINENIIAKSIGFDNARDLKENLKNVFAGIDEATQVLCEKDFELREKSRINQVETYEKVKKIITDFCKNSSIAEYEASLCEYLIAQKQGFEDKNSEITYKFHKLIAQAFE